MNRWWKWIGLFVLSVAVGIWIGFNEFTPLQELLLLFCLLMSMFLLFIIPTFYTLNITQNVDKVELLLNRSRVKNSIYALMLDVANGDFDAAERHIPLIRNKQVQLSALISLHLERQEIEQARSNIDNVQFSSNRNYFKALIAITENDWDRVEEFQAGIRNKALRYVIDAEAAFKRGNYEVSEQAGRLALANAKGLQKFVLLRSLERQESNHLRRTYF
jgi:hypothetical protein